ncbi:Protein of unknown function [Gryllus bimaculatus]|nr:Protein of unknown function [Gryllus bimaculatus]
MNLRTEVTLAALWWLKASWSASCPGDTAVPALPTPACTPASLENSGLPRQRTADGDAAIL